MKLLLILGGFSLALIIGLSIIANGMIERAKERQRTVETEFGKRADALRALPPESLPFSQFDAESFAQWVAVRVPLAELLERRFAEQAQDRYFHRHETVHLALDLLRAALAERKLSLAGYLARCDRWLALLARAGDEDLLAAYREKTRSRTQPAGPPLPPPGGGDAEVELLKLHRERLRASLSADLLLPPLRQIVGQPAKGP